jgi:hypothetical protein
MRSRASDKRSESRRVQKKRASEWLGCVTSERHLIALSSCKHSSYAKQVTGSAIAIRRSRVRHTMEERGIKWLKPRNAQFAPCLFEIACESFRGFDSGYQLMSLLRMDGPLQEFFRSLARHLLVAALVGGKTSSFQDWRAIWLVALNLMSCPTSERAALRDGLSARNNPLYVFAFRRFNLGSGRCWNRC